MGEVKTQTLSGNDETIIWEEVNGPKAMETQGGGKYKSGGKNSCIKVSWKKEARGEVKGKWLLWHIYS